MNNKTLQIAFIGGGVNSAVGYVHFSACQMDNRFKVVAGAFSRDPEKNYKTAEKWGVDTSRCYDNWRDLVKNEKDKIDAVVVLTPTTNHLEILIELLQNNIPIICEKALVTGPKEISELKKHFNHEKNFLAVTFNYSGYAMVRELRDMIENGKLGKIQKILLEMPQEGFRRPPDIAGKMSPPQEWRLHDYEVPTICLDLGVHLHHLSTFLLKQEPDSTMAYFSNHSTYNGLIDDVQMLLRYPNNIVGHMWMSKTAIGNRNGLKISIYGDKGSAKWVQINPDELEMCLLDGSRITIDRASQCKFAGEFRYNRMKPGHPTGFIEAFANLYTDINDALHVFNSNQTINSTFVFGIDHASDGLDLFKAAKKSHEIMTWVNIKR